jgi:hypothetical protein
MVMVYQTKKMKLLVAQTNWDQSTENLRAWVEYLGSYINDLGIPWYVYVIGGWVVWNFFKLFRRRRRSRLLYKKLW